jgi:iron complex outermembrane receptor protein
VPAIFAQDEIALSARFSAAASGRVDLHPEYGTFFSPRVSLLFRPRADTSVRLSAGTGFAAPSPFNERTETVGLSPLLPYQDLDAERAESISLDAGWSAGGLELNGTIFASKVRHALLVRDSIDQPGRIEIVNAPEPTETYGTELLVRYVRGPLQLIATHTFVDATESEPAGTGRRDVPLTPQHSAELAAIVESEERGRIGAELSYTGTQSLEDNPYRKTSEAYLQLSVLGEVRIGETRVYVNAMNLTDVHQTDYDPLYLPQQAADGRWTTDAWAPLEGRVFNAGVRLEF